MRGRRLPGPRGTLMSAPASASRGVVPSPATDGAPSLSAAWRRCEAGEPPAGRGGRADREPAGSGPAAARNVGARRPAPRCSSSSTPTSRCTPTRWRGSSGTSPPTPSSAPSSAPTTTTPPPRASPRASATSSTTTSTPAPRARRRPSGRAWARSGARRSRPPAGFDAERFPAAERRGHRAGDAPATRRRAGIAPRPAIRGRHLKAWTPLTMVRTDFAAAGRALGAAAALARGAAARRSTSAWRHRLSAAGSVACSRCRCSPAARDSRRGAARGPRPRPRPLRAARPPRRPASAASPGVGLHQRPPADGRRGAGRRPRPHLRRARAN